MAAAEAMNMARQGCKKRGAGTFLVSETCHPQTLAVVQTRAEALGVKVVIAAPESFQFDEQVFGVLLQTPDTTGVLHDYTALIEQAHAAGALVILDEVLTGFRVGPAGWWGLENAPVEPVETYLPDLFTWGKVLGGGLPLAGLGGRAELMDQLAPLGPVYQAGTLSGNPLAVAAGIATLRLADADVYARVDAAAARVSTAVRICINLILGSCPLPSRIGQRRSRGLFCLESQMPSPSSVSALRLSQIESKTLPLALRSNLRMARKAASGWRSRIAS